MQPNILKIKTHTDSLAVEVELYITSRPNPFKAEFKCLYLAYDWADTVCGCKNYIVEYED